MRPFTKEEKSWMEKRLDFIYEDFTSKLARSRALSPEQVDVVARGRIWSGRDAQERGLVDELGGFLTAVDASRRAAGLDPDQKVRVVAFPPPKTGFEQLMDFFKARFGVMELWMCCQVLWSAFNLLWLDFLRVFLRHHQVPSCGHLFREGVFCFLGARVRCVFGSSLFSPLIWYGEF